MAQGRDAANSFSPQGLEQLHADDNSKGVPLVMADKLRKLLFTLETANDLDQVSRFPGWKLHPLKGALKDFWSENAYEKPAPSGRFNQNRDY